MMGSDKKVIYITRSKIEGIRVSSGVSPKVKDRFGADYTLESLPDLLAEAIKKLSSGEIYLLLGKDLSYVINFKMEDDDEKTEREKVYEKVKKEIPEKLEDDEWGYITSGAKKGEKEALAFAPVRSFFEIISQTLITAKCKVVLIEPEEVAQIWNNDPVIGITQSKEVGKNNSLKIDRDTKADHKDNSENTQKAENSKDYHETDTEKEPRVRKNYLLALSIVFVAGTLLIGVMLYFRTSIPKQAEEAQASIKSSPTSTPVPTPNFDIESLKVEVLNGSGIEGRATTVSDILAHEGFKNIEIGNADSYDYTTTEIQVKEDIDSDKLNELLKDTLQKYKVEFGKPLQKNDEFDLLITVGKDEY